MTRQPVYLIFLTPSSRLELQTLSGYIIDAKTGKETAVV